LAEILNLFKTMARTKYIRRTNKDVGKEAPKSCAFVTEKGAEWLEGRRKTRPPERYADHVTPDEIAQSRESASMKKALRGTSVEHDSSGNLDGDDMSEAFSQLKKPRTASASIKRKGSESHKTVVEGTDPQEVEGYHEKGASKI